VALHRGRLKLKAAPAQAGRVPSDPTQIKLLSLYADLFNQRDWEGVKKLLRADVHCEVVGVFSGIGPQSLEEGYLRNYSRLPAFRMSLAQIDGEAVVISREQDGDNWTIGSVIRLVWEDGQIISLHDYRYVPYLLQTARAFYKTG
jgi:RNA polymerase sigma-70 factor (ECF subfamily)